MFESEDYRNRRQLIDQDMRERQEAVFRRVEQSGAENNIALVRTPNGLALAPTRDHEIITPEDFQKLPEEARRRGIDLSAQRARQVKLADFETFAYIPAMDRATLRDLAALAPARHEDRVRLFLDFAPQLGLRDVPDPYYGGGQGFEQVLNLVEAAATGLLSHLRVEHPYLP
ncbi:MAG: low molecular weight phosphotyrosine protein phosphatase [Alphaproteobacteria bacterium]|nr:low molecular weight phosphotyrosine protein phosphatase [Alphaproteobacteria bacterium]